MTDRKTYVVEAADHVLAPIHVHPLLEIYTFPMREDQYYVYEEPTHQRVLSRLVALGLITPALYEDDPECGHSQEELSEWHITDKGRAYIEGLLQVPMPVQVWEVPRDAP